MKLGYIRVSRDKQTIALQEDAMRQEQCERTFTDKMTARSSYACLTWHDLAM